MLITIYSMGKLDNVSYISETFMKKLFVFAATSIACILSVISIADAKVPKGTKVVNRDLGCQSQTRLNNQVENISTEDIRSICKIITNHYRDGNERGRINESERKNFRALEVTKMKIVSANETTTNSVDYVLVNIEFIHRTYTWDSENKKWLMPKENPSVVDVVFLKRNGKWTYTEDRGLWTRYHTNMIFG
jgi:hypothetical protein